MFLLESFVKVGDKVPFDQGFVDTYEIELRNGQKFEVNFSFNSGKHVRELAGKAIVEADHKNNLEVVGGYESFTDISDDEYVVMIEFKDSEGRHDDTGKVGIHAKELFEMLKRSYIHSMDSGIREKVRGIMMRVDKNNPKRMNFYMVIIKRYLGETFNNIFVDPYINANSNYDLLIAVK